MRPGLLHVTAARERVCVESRSSWSQAARGCLSVSPKKGWEGEQSLRCPACLPSAVYVWSALQPPVLQTPFLPPLWARFSGWGGAVHWGDVCGAPQVPQWI